jgi:hypothetical protein
MDILGAIGRMAVQTRLYSPQSIERMARLETMAMVFEVRKGISHKEFVDVFRQWWQSIPLDFDEALSRAQWWSRKDFENIKREFCSS